LEDGLLVGEQSKLRRVLDFLTTIFAVMGLRETCTSAAFRH